MDSPYPIGELLICVGLIAVMIIENMAAEYEHVAHEVKVQASLEDEDDEAAALFDPHNHKALNGHSHDGGGGHGHGGGGHSHTSHFAMVSCVRLASCVDSV